MGHLQIHCYGCGHEWSVYHRDDLRDWKIRTCPVCGKKVSQRTWDRDVLTAFDQLENANLELARDHTQDHGTLFSVAYVPDVIFPEAEKENGLREEISDLRESVDSIKNVVGQLLTRLFEE